MSDLSWVTALRTETLTQFFVIFPFFASETTYLILISIGYWSWDKKVFKDFAILVCLSTMLNCWLKHLFHIPRPNIEHLVIVHDPFGFPSGDIQIVATFWFALAWHFKQPLLWLFAILLTILVGISRVYLGVHYPIDVIAGAIIGILLVVVYYAFKHSSIWKFIKPKETVLALLFFIFLASYLFSMQDDLTIMCITSSGILLGIFIGSSLESKFCSPAPNYNLNMRIAAGLIALSTLFILRTGLMSLWRQDPRFIYAFIIYTILGVHIIFFVPWLVSKVAMLIDLNKAR